MSHSQESPDSITSIVEAKYAEAARSGLSGHQPGVKQVAEAFGYSSEELASIPAEANLGLSCGNPTAMASLREGEVVVDLGCGAGIDVLLAAKRVGSTGKAIGIDMTDSMLDLARRNAAQSNGGVMPGCVEFHKAQIDAMPLRDGSVDCVISNCVINLAPDKPAVFREIARVLKPGGRVAVSDIALKKPLPPELANDIAALVGCIAGAISLEEYETGLREAGFSEVQIIDAQADLNAYALAGDQAGCCSPSMTTVEPTTTFELPVLGGGCCSSTNVGGGCCGSEDETSESLHAGLAELLTRYDVNEYAASVKVFAVKPS